MNSGHDLFFFQAEDGIRDLVRSRGLGDVYKRQIVDDLGGSCQKGGLTRHANAIARGCTGFPIASLHLSLIHI